jgi:hypothetical protein
MIQRAEFENVVKILRSIDHHELVAAGLSLAGNEWQTFSSNPPMFLIRADDETADKIWSVVVKRSTRRAAA